MNRDEIIEAVFAIILVVVVLGAFIWMCFNIKDTKPVKSNTYTQQTPQQKTEGHCSILADKCIVDEWSIKCLWFDCIVDGRD